MTTDRAALVEKLRSELRRPPYAHNEQYGVGWFDAITTVLSLLSAEPDEPAQFVVSPIHAGEEGDGPLASTDGWLKARGLSLLVNVPTGSHATFSLIVDGSLRQNGTLGLSAEPERPKCRLCSKMQPCPEHGRTPIKAEDFAELSRVIAADAEPERPETPKDTKMALIAIMNALDVHMPPDGSDLLYELRKIAETVGYPWEPERRPQEGQ